MVLPIGRPWPERLDEGSCANDRNRIPSAQEPRERTRADTGLRAIAESLPTPDRAKRAWTNPRRESLSADKASPEAARGIEAVDPGAREGPTPLVNFVNAAS